MSRTAEHPHSASELQLMRPILRRCARAAFDPDLRHLEGTAFALSRDEHRFALRLLDRAEQWGLRKHNLWLFRSSQVAFAGDFVIVDVSGPTRAPRRRGQWTRPPLAVPAWDAFVVELKMGASLCLTGGGASNQLQRAEPLAHEAVREAFARRLGAARARRYADVIHGVDAARVVPVVGSRRRVIGFFDRLREIRRQARRVRGDWTRAVARAAPQLLAPVG